MALWFNPSAFFLTFALTFFSYEIMKNRICSFLLFIIAATAAISCAKTLEESQFNEFEIKDSNGSIRRGGVYIPKGIKTDSEYPVIFMEDGLVFKECGFRRMIDSLIEKRAISPVIVACSYENKMTVPGYRIAYRNAEYVEALAKTDEKLAKLFDDHYVYFKETFIPYINSSYPVSAKTEDRIYFGTSNSADFGLTLSMRNGDMFSEYWCYSPVYSDISDYGMLAQPVRYRICWGVKEEIGHDDYFAALMKDLRKRGGVVESWSFDGGHDREWWKYWFREELKRRFPYKN